MSLQILFILLLLLLFLIIAVVLLQILSILLMLWLFCSYRKKITVLLLVFFLNCVKLLHFYCGVDINSECPLQ